MSASEMDPRWRVPWSVRLPSAMSVTLAMKADQCPRDAAMYLRDRGLASSGPLLRGSLGHLAVERIMNELMVTGEASLVAAHEGEDPARAAAEIANTTRAWVDELAEEMRWPVSEHELDAARQVAYNFAVANDVDPQLVVALEDAFILELEDGGRLLGKVDLAWLRPDGVLEVRDYKTSMFVPSSEELKSSLQVPLYAALLLWGRKYRRETCSTCEGEKVYRYEAQPTGVPAQEGPCPDCDALGYVEIIGERLDLEQYTRWIHCEQVYPRFVNESTGQLSRRTVPNPLGGDFWSTADLRDKVLAASRIWRTRVKVGVENQWWPAKASEPDKGHCNQCTARSECPIPSRLRRHAGEILSAEQAAEAFEWANRQGALVKATRAEVKAFVKAEELPFLQVGEDRYGFVVTHPTSARKKGQNTDWEGLQEAVAEAAGFGEPFDIRDWLVSKPKTDFRKLKASDDEEVA